MPKLFEPSVSLRGWFTFSLRTLLLLVGGVCLFFGLRHNYVFAEGSLNEVIARARLVPQVFAALVAGYVCVVMRTSENRKQSAIVYTALAGAITACLCAAALGIEIAEGVRKHYPEYFDWTRVWPLFALDVLARHATDGALIGLLIGFAWRACRFVMSQFSRPKTP